MAWRQHVFANKVLLGHGTPVSLLPMAAFALQHQSCFKEKFADSNATVQKKRSEMSVWSAYS